MRVQFSLFPQIIHNMWLKESNRPKHLLYAIPAAFVGTILFDESLANIYE